MRAGTLKTKNEYYAAAKELISQLGDRYSEYLEPSAFRAAIRKPTKAELDYLSGQAVGAQPCRVHCPAICTALPSAQPFGPHCQCQRKPSPAAVECGGRA